MKRIIIYVLSLLIMFFSTSCVNDAQHAKKNNRESYTEIANEEEQNKVEKIWEKRYFVDEFNQPTDTSYIVNSDPFVGTFSNSATTDSELCVDIIIESDEGEWLFGIALYEYGNMLVKNPYSTFKFYNIVIKDDDGNKHESDGMMLPNSDNILFYEDYVLEALKKGEDLAFYICEKEQPITNYLFTIKGSNFNEFFKTCE